MIHPVHRMVMCVLKLIFADIERAMEDTQDIDASIILDQVGDTVVAVEKNAHMAARCPVAMAHLRKGRQRLDPLIYAVDGLGSRMRIIRSNILEDVLEPTLGFCCPSYLCHERMRRAISSFEMTRPASESASPRSTIR